MPKSHTGSELTSRVSELLSERHRHQTAIEQIDATISRVSAALGGGMPKIATAPLAAKRRGRPPGFKPVTTAVAAVAKPKRGRRRRGKFAVSGDESVLTFIKSHKNATTQDVNKHWKNEGRGNTADNTLTKLVKEKKLKRTPLQGKRGSSYTVV